MISQGGFMIVKCVANQGVFNPIVLPKDPLLPIGNVNCVISSEYCTIDAHKLGYSITVERDYCVYGMFTYRHELRYLIIDDNGLPGFLPADLFIVTNSRLPYDLCYKEYHLCGEKCQLIACEKLTQSYDALLDFLETKGDSISDFLDYKKNVEEWLNF